MRTSLIAIIVTLLLSACGNGANENKGTETPTASPQAEPADTSRADTMMQPNGVSNGTVTDDTLHR